MSKLPPTLRDHDALATSRSPMKRPWREPLLHFLLLGVLLFAVDRIIWGGAEDARTIVVDAAVDNEAREIFAAARGREPSEEELAALRSTWLDNEVLYREGLELRLDEGDETIRERVIFKALSVINAGLSLPPHDDAVLRAWFEQHRERYDDPARFDFQEAVLTGEPSDDAIRHFVAALNAGNPGEDARASLRVFRGRPRGNLLQSYGEGFVAHLEAQTVGEWRALPSLEGLRAIRLESVSEPVSADFEELRGVVQQDWTDATMAEQRTAAVRALAKKYEVRVEAAAPGGGAP